MRNADAVVIGGGIIGSAVAYYLSNYFETVVVIERKSIASESSGANYGMVWQQTRQPGYDLAMAQRSLFLYRNLIEDVFDIDVEYEYNGGMTVFLTEIQKKAAADYVRLKKSKGVPLQLLDGYETRELEPELSQEVQGCIYCPDEAHVNPFKVTIAFARAAKKNGAKIFLGTSVLGIETEKGRIKSVITDNIGKINTPVIINAAGSWATEIGKMVGIEIPVYPHRLQSIVTEQLPPTVTRVIQGARIAKTAEEAAQTFQYAFDTTSGVKPRIDQGPPEEDLIESALPFIKPTINGNIVLGLTSDFVGYNKKTSCNSMCVIAANAVRLIPKLKNVNIIRSWANFDPWTVDNIPIVSKTPIDGFVVAAGHGTALSHAPATAEALTSLIVFNSEPDVLKSAQLYRFV